MSTNKRIQKFNRLAEQPPTPPVDEPMPKPFPIHCLPPTVAAMAEAICRTERTPESLVGCCVLGNLSASIGAGLQVRSAPDRVTRANLFIMASGESGSGKSESLRHAALAIREFERELLETWTNEILPGLLAEKELLESDIAALKKPKTKAKTRSYDPLEREETRAELERKRKALLRIEPQLQPPVLIVEDITSQTLAERLAMRGECLFSLTADGGEVINNLMGQYNKLDRTDDGLYVKAWSGDPFKRDRMGKPHVILNQPCLAALWLVQREKMDTILSERALTEGGAIPRLLLCHTNCQPRYIEEGGIGIPADVAQAYRALIRELLETFRLAAEPVTIEPSPEALRAMNDHYNLIVARWHKGELRDVTSYAVRWTEQAWRISGCLHAGIHGKQAGERSLALETAQAAITIADWYSAQQLEILAAGRQAAKDANRTAILYMLVDRPKGITARDVQRALHLATADEASSFLEEMMAEGILEREDVATGGRPQRLYRKARK